MHWWHTIINTTPHHKISWRTPESQEQQALRREAIWQFRVRVHGGAAASASAASTSVRPCRPMSHQQTHHCVKKKKKKKLFVDPMWAVPGYTMWACCCWGRLVEQSQILPVSDRSPQYQGTYGTVEQSEPEVNGSKLHDPGEGSCRTW